MNQGLDYPRLSQTSQKYDGTFGIKLTFIH